MCLETADLSPADLVLSVLQKERSSQIRTLVAWHSPT